MPNSGQTDTSPSAKQLVFLAMMATVVAVVVFLCGVLVGRGVPARRTLGTAIDAGLPAGAGLGLEAGGGDLAPDASPLDDLSYYGRLNEAPPSTDGSPGDAGTPSAAPLEAGEPAAADAAPDRPASPIPGGDTTREPVPSAAAVVPLPETAAAPSAVEASYMVQVTALRSRDEARAVASRLQGAGYSAIVVNPPDGAEVGLFRVRVGPFPDRAAAESVRPRLEAEEGFTTWVIEP